MAVLRDISFLWSMLHIVVLFLLLFEPRYPWRRTLLLSFAGWLALLAGNVLLMLCMGHGIIMRAAFFTCTLPSMALFFVLSKYRNGRFFFLFCLTDTVCFWILQITNFLDRLTGGSYAVMLISRLVLFPIAEYIFWKYLRRPYLELQSKIGKGWNLFAAIGGVYYLLIMVTAVPVGYPMPDGTGLAAILLVMILMPLTYLTIFHALWQQMQSYESSRQLERQRQDYAAICRKMELERIYRHDMRHHLIVLEGLLRQGDSGEARQYVRELRGKLAAINQKRWCANTAVNAVLASYIAQAEESGCRVQAGAEIPAELPYSEMDICIMLANVLENAIQACQKLEKEERWIELKVELTENRRLMLLADNGCPTPVEFSSDGLPAGPREEGHGMGLRSVRAIVSRYGGIFRSQWEEGRFRVQAVLFLPEK